jgi:methionine-rich copper-binding protein CopC
VSFTLRRLCAFSPRRHLTLGMGSQRMDLARAADLHLAEPRSQAARTARPALFVIVASLVAFLGFTIGGFTIGGSAAFAHSRLVKSDPAARAILSTAPKELKLWFNEAIEVAFAKVWLISPDGAQVPLTNHGDASDPRMLIVTLPDNLSSGPVVIGYHVLSVDGHVVESQLTFNVEKKPA